MKIFSKVLSAVVAASMILSMVVVSYAAGGSNILNYDVLVDGEEVTKIFEGEKFDVVISPEDFDYFDAYDVAYRYDPAHIQLVSNNGTAMSAANKTFFDALHGEDPYMELEEGTYGITLKNDFALSTTIFFVLSPEDGAIRLAQMYDGAMADFDTKTEMMVFSFEALEKTDANDKVLRYATKAQDNSLFSNLCDYIGLETLVNGYSFAQGGADLTMSSNIIPEIQIFEKPTLTGISWGAEGSADEYFVSWETPVEGCRGYEMTVTKNGSKVGDPIKLDKDATSFNMFEIIKGSKEGSATEKYNVTLVALGGVGSTPVNAEKDVKGIPLSAPENVVLNKEVLSWSPVDNADKYIVTITDALGNTQDKEVSSTSVNLDSYLTVGDYEITVTAKNNLTMYIPATSAPVEYSTGSTVTGKVRYNVPNPGILIYNKDLRGVVTLTSDTNTYTGYVAENGKFEIANVENGEYTVSITRPGAVTRTFANKLSFNASVSKDICAAGEEITIFLGDAEQATSKEQIGSNDISLILGKLGSLKTDATYDANADFTVPAAGSSIEKIDTTDLMIIIRNYGYTEGRYQAYANEVSF